MSKKFRKGICYECDPENPGGSNHPDCRNGKKSREGKPQTCKCFCQMPGYKSKRRKKK